MNNTSEEAFGSYRRGMFDIIVGSFSILIISAASTFGNIAVVMASYYDEGLKVQVGNLLIVNLAATDILAGTAVMIPCLAAVIADEWIFGKIACDFHGFANYCCVTVSNVTLAMISYDRGTAILHPLHYPQWMTQRKILLLMAFSWFQGFAICMPLLTMNWAYFDYSEAMCTVEWDRALIIDIYIYICFTCNFFIPTLFIFFYNIRILISALKTSKSSVKPVQQSLKTISNSSSQKVKSKSKSDSSLKTVISMYVVIIIFFICFSPFAFTKLSKAFGGKRAVPEWTNYFATITQFMASATNPFIYAILRRDYRNAFKKLPRIMGNKMRNLFYS